MINQSLSANLNCLRWIAAFLVVISHIRNLLFVNYGELESKTPLIKALYFFTGFGHEAVIIFFVISGLLVGGTSLQKHMAGRFDATDYVINRFSRIYIVLIPALLAGHLLDNIGIAFFDDAGMYTQSMLYNSNRVYADNSSWEILLGNVLMIHHILVPTLGTNGPLWSLAYEWWYYALFLCGLCALSATNSGYVRTAFAAALVLLMLFLPAKILLWFLIWLVGLAVPVSPLRRIRIPLWLAYGAFVGVLIWSRFDHTLSTERGMHITFFRDLAVACGCFVLFTALSQQEDNYRPGRLEKVHGALAEFSYTTYLVHFPFLVFAVAGLNSLFGVAFHQQPTLTGWIYFVALLAAVYLYSYVFSRLTEAHTGRLRQWIQTATKKRIRHAS